MPTIPSANRREAKCPATGRRALAASAAVSTVDPAKADTYLAKAYQAGWDGIIRQSPVAGPKLKEFFQKAR